MHKNFHYVIQLYSFSPFIFTPVLNLADVSYNYLDRKLPSKKVVIFKENYNTRINTCTSYTGNTYICYLEIPFLNSFRKCLSSSFVL